MRAVSSLQVGGMTGLEQSTILPLNTQAVCAGDKVYERLHGVARHSLNPTVSVKSSGRGQGLTNPRQRCVEAQESGS